MRRLCYVHNALMVSIILLAQVVQYIVSPQFEYLQNIAEFKTFFANDLPVVHVRFYRSVPYTLDVPVVVASHYLLS